MTQVITTLASTFKRLVRFTAIDIQTLEPKLPTLNIDFQNMLEKDGLLAD